MRVKSGLDKVMEEIQALCLLPIHQNLVKFLEFLEDENGDAMYIGMKTCWGVQTTSTQPPAPSQFWNWPMAVFSWMSTWPLESIVQLEGMASHSRRKKHC